MEGDIPIMWLSGWAIAGTVVTTVVTAFMTGKIKPSSWTDAQIAALEKDRDYHRERCKEYEDELRFLPHTMADLVLQLKLAAEMRERGISTPVGGKDGN